MQRIKCHFESQYFPCLLENMASSTGGNQVSFSVKWAGKLYTIDGLDPAAATVADLKSAIHAKTDVLPARQKLLNLRFKVEMGRFRKNVTRIPPTHDSGGWSRLLISHCKNYTAIHLFLLIYEKWLMN